MNQECTQLMSLSKTSSNRQKRFRTRFCINSRTACLLLLLNFGIFLGYNTVYNVNIVMQVVYTSFVPIIVNAVLDTVVLFAPIVGIFADIRLSRYKAVVCSTYVILIEVMVMVLIAITALVAIVASVNYKLVHYPAYNIIIQAIAFAYLGVMAISYVVFLINAFQFGIDQLLNSSADDLVSFIHWYVWIYHLSVLIMELQWNLLLYDSYYVNYLDGMRLAGLCILVLVFICMFSAIIFSLCTLQQRKAWFMLEPPAANPYKLVYRVIKFAAQHRVPLRRSAFTYCEDEQPSRLDLGKSKYGGPFTTQQVEDIKAFLGILKILITVGPAFFLQTVVQSLLPVFARHNNIMLYTSFLEHNETVKHQVHPEGALRHILVSNGLLSPLLVVLFIPLYMWLIRPRFLYHMPGMLKRMGTGIALMVLSLVCAFVMDFIVHKRRTEHAECMFSSYAGLDILPAGVNTTSESPLFQNAYFFTSQYVLSALFNMLMDVAILEFICSQSPYALRGLVFGIYLSVRSLFQGLAIVSVVPFAIFWKASYALSCCSGFYITSIIVGALTCCLFTHIARRYKYRILNEPSNEYQYAENYYSNIQ